MSPYVITILVSSLGLGTTLTFMSSHWLLAWMGLEINTLAILPLMAQHHHPRAVEATIKYFLAQAAAAATILFASTINAWTTGEWNIHCLMNPIAATLVTMALALKVGLAPVHFWMPPVMQGLDLPTGLIMATWQKLAPFALIIQMAPFTNSQLLIMLGTLSVFIGGWGGLNQTQLRKILAYSSIAHLGWMIVIVQFKPQLTILTLITYIIMTSATFLTFKLMHTTKINTLATSWSKTPTIMIIATLALLSLGGLPPLTGFMPKWLILQELTTQELPLIATIMALSALLSLYFYMRLCYSMALTISPNTNNSLTPWRLHNTQNMMPLTISMTATLLLLPLTPLAQALTN
uniref:NADH-ubiquinone oxidoreductase chain 2 n=1 Tax=Hemibagrus guttatus TaxID=175788 RepID=X2L1X2_9TELE|nr:NADH dehydrogenase subunit 2 [Hemibagrus guttatus]AHN95373.1 NADH dehydrogenase subunit 2 [Hemibagrus guttatus]AIA26456.1 NADH dehydrogenase subunit 2 [Hemibagrus guttatus]